MSDPIPGRARTPEQKRAIVERLLTVWEKRPELRLGQLLQNSMTAAQWRGGLFYVEDDLLADFVEEFLERPF